MKKFLFSRSNEGLSTPAQKVCFTSNSIHYLATTHLPVNLDEWEWHEEMIDGTYTCVITDKKLPELHQPARPF